MSVGAVAQAFRDGAVFVDAKSNDLVFSTKTLGQRILLGFAPSNFASTLSLGNSNMILGTPASNVASKQWGDASINGFLDVSKNITMSNAFILNQAGIGSNVNMIDPNLTLYVDGSTRIQGDLIVNGNIQAIDTDVTVTDEFHIINNGTGPALQVNQIGVTPIASFQQSNTNKVLITADGRVFIGSNVSPPTGPTDPIVRVDIQGGMFLQGSAFMSNITGSNATFDTIKVLCNVSIDDMLTLPNAYLTNLYMGNKLIIDNSGVITNSNWIPTLDTSKVQYGTFTSNFIENYHVISSKLASNLTIAGTTYFAGNVGIGTSNPTQEVAGIKLKVGSGDMMVTGPDDFQTTGNQARLYFGPHHFVGAACNVGIVMQVPNTTYPFVMEDGTGYVGLGVMDPEERLHINDNLKVNNMAYIASNIAIGFSNGPSENLAVFGNMSLSNFGGKVVFWTSNNNMGVNTATPAAMIHIRNAITGRDSMYVDTTVTPFIIKADGKVGIGKTAPTESLDVHEHAKVASNLYVIGNIAVKNSNPGFDLDVWGNARIKRSLYVDGGDSKGGALNLCNPGAVAEGTGQWVVENSPIGPSNHLWIYKLTSNATMTAHNVINVSDDGLLKVGGNTLADERLHVSYGHVKIDSNLYVMRRQGICTSNPAEGLDVAPSVNAKFGSNAYVMSRLGVGTSNPAYAIDVVGDINLTGVMSQGAGNANFGANVFVMNNLGIGTSNPTESLHVQYGNAKIGSNLYVADGIGIATSNPTERLDLRTGNAKIGSNAYVMNRVAVGGTSNPQVILELQGTDAVLLPVGTTLQRPDNPFQGYVRYNTTFQTFEGFGAGNAWGSLGGVKDTNQDTYISPESWPTSNDDTLRFFNSNSETLTMTMCNITVRTETTHFSRAAGLMMKVGINTSNPTKAFDMVGDARITSGSFTMSNFAGNIVLHTSNSLLGLQTPNPVVAFHVNTKDAICIPSGDLVERPASAIPGCIRYNTTYQTFEGFGAGSVWGSLGGVKDTNQDTYITAESFPTSNDDIIRFYNSNVETVRVMPTGFIGLSNQAPSERLEVSGGNAKLNSNLYVLARAGINTSNPTESLDIDGAHNAKFGSNVYIMNRVGVATSNPQVSLEIQTTDSILLPKGTTAQRPGDPVQGYIRYNTTYQTFEGFGAGNAWGSLGGVKDTNQDTYISAESFPTSNDDILRFYNSNVETMRIMPDGFIGMSNPAPSERLELSGGNAKFSSNAYVMSRVGVGLSNPLQSVHVVGNVRCTSGTLGPMMMLIPPIAYADVQVDDRLVLDNTLEAGNDIANGTWRSLYFGTGFLFQDAGDEAMQWNQARIVFRGTALTNDDNETTTMAVQEYVHWRTPQYSNITAPFAILSRTQQRGFMTNATPWFSMSSTDVRHLAINVNTSTSSSAYRFGSAYIQFRA